MKLGIANLQTKLLAPATIIQAALPDMFANIPEQFFTDTMDVFEQNANLCYAKLKEVPGLTPVCPEGAMYMMVSLHAELACMLVQISACGYLGWPNEQRIHHWCVLLINEIKDPGH